MSITCRPASWHVRLLACVRIGLFFFLCFQALLLQGDYTTDAPNMLGVVFETHQGSRLVDGTLLELSEKEKLIQSLLDTVVIVTAVAAVCWTPLSAAVACVKGRPNLSCEPRTDSPETTNLDFRRRGRDSKTEKTGTEAKEVVGERGEEEPDAANASAVNEGDGSGSGAVQKYASRTVDRETDTGDEFKDEKRLGLEGEARQNRAAKDKNRGIQEDIARMQRDYDRFVSQVSGLVRTSHGRGGSGRFLHSPPLLWPPSNCCNDVAQPLISKQEKERGSVSCAEPSSGHRASCCPCACLLVPSTSMHVLALQAPAKDSLHSEILSLEHAIKAAKRDHTVLLASSIDTLLLPANESTTDANQLQDVDSVDDQNEF